MRYSVPLPAARSRLTHRRPRRRARRSWRWRTRRCGGCCKTARARSSKRLRMPLLPPRRTTGRSPRRCSWSRRRRRRPARPPRGWRRRRSRRRTMRPQATSPLSSALRSRRRAAASTPARPEPATWPRCVPCVMHCSAVTWACALTCLLRLLALLQIAQNLPLLIALAQQQQQQQQRAATAPAS